MCLDIFTNLLGYLYKRIYVCMCVCVYIYIYIYICLCVSLFVSRYFEIVPTESYCFNTYNLETVPGKYNQ